MLKKVVIAALATTIALPAVAQAVSQGDQMLSRIEGVQPGSLSTAELVELSAARGPDGDLFTAEQLVKTADNGTATRAAYGASEQVSAGRAQLAAQLGVNPADFSLSQLVRLNDAVKENDATTVRAIFQDAGVNAPATTILR
ncbi:hypothetical protein [Qingshengfaniella alkalisoli]|uniref:DUF4148 domain-containing protein n=1 Tax=Qingshengfaniella alkalisoli TaxID=2599296 RepID=A0A5B8IUE8_9RHOB|nr:hypothetical protein [Qingshengfaniella alkalisoli]QDY69742.1 hypothetical protein FPZ52_09000 [Qingshengfaniella alkalisoli]